MFDVIRFRLTSRNARLAYVLAGCAMVVLSVLPLPATGFQFQDPIGGFNQGNGPPVFSQDPVTFSAEFFLEPGSNKGRVTLTADISFGYHIYSLTQEGGPGPTIISMADHPNVSLGEFAHDAEPQVHENDPTWGTRVEDYEIYASFTAPIELSNVQNAEELTFDLIVDGQACDANGCILISGKRVAASFGGYLEVPAKPGELRPEVSHLRWEGRLEPKVAAPGDTIRLIFTAYPDEGYHLYGFDDSITEEAKKAGFSPTLIVLNRNGWHASRPQSSVKPVPHEVFDGAKAYWHESPVEFSIDIFVPKDAEEKAYELNGFLAFQTCEGTMLCDLPEAAEFRATIQVGSETQPGQTDVLMVNSSRDYMDVHALAERAEWSSPESDPFSQQPVLVILGFAFLAGLILNVMPCVLPVIGLKIMSFVDQAGANRFKVISLNFWFSVGLISVFMILATLAAFFKLGWGGHFQSVGFTITMIGIVFAMGLSFLGVWEIPIPGFAGGQSANKMADKEGVMGAFSKGVLTTILATPCTGPFLVPAVSWAITQPPWLTYLLFFAVGLGMSSPYLLIGVFPGMIKLLPKPGAWMLTFKQLMGFVLMGTAVFLFSTLSESMVLPVLTLIVGIAFACWWIGRTPMTAPKAKQLKAWAGGGAWLAAIGSFAFLYLGGGILFAWTGGAELEWEQFDRVALEDHVEDGKTVLIDFTADW